MVKRIGAIGLFLLLLLLPVSVFGERNLVFDEAGLFTPQQVQDLEEKLEALNEKHHVDFILTTTADTQGKSAQTYAGDSYEDIYGMDHDGANFLMDMDNGEIFFSSSGFVIDVFTDVRWNDLLDRTFDYMVEGDYYGAALAYIETSDDYLTQGVQAGTYREPQKKEKSYGLKEALIALLGGGAAGGGFFSSNKNKLLYKPRGKNFLYQKNSFVHLFADRDNLIDERRSVRVIPIATGPGNGKRDPSLRSTTHRSSRGGTRGGGGRKFK